MKSKIMEWLVWALTGIVCLVIVLVFEVVLDIVLTVVFNKIFDVDTQSDWLERFKKVYHFFKRKLG